MTHALTISTLYKPGFANIADILSPTSMRLAVKKGLFQLNTTVPWVVHEQYFGTVHEGDSQAL